MFQSRLSKRLAGYVSLLLLSFSAVIVLMFVLLFQNQAVDIHREHLTDYARIIAEAVVEEPTTQGQGQGHGQGAMYGQGGGHHGLSSNGLGAYLRFTSQVASAELWLVDRAHTISILKMEGGNEVYGSLVETELPTEAPSLFDRALSGETVDSTLFSNHFGLDTLTVGVPVYGDFGELLGAVFIHSPVQESTDAVYDGLLILLGSILVALVVAIVLSVFLANSFTRPLKVMGETALRLYQHDYTAKCNIERKDELGELSSILDALSERLLHTEQEREGLEQLRRDFIANISHELKTPVTVIKGSLEALCDGVVTEGSMVADYQRSMLTEAVFLERLIGDLLELTRLQNTGFSIEKEEVVCADILSDVTRSMSVLAGGRQVSLRVNCASHHTLMGDYGRIRQMIATVLSNAIKFSHEGGVVDVQFEGKTLTIRDYGIGMEQAHIPHIFEKFYRTKSAENRDGVGLGLAIAKEIALRHEIGIDVESTPGTGTTFVFHFP